jgi:hypothetical protein
MRRGLDIGIEWLPRQLSPGPSEDEELRTDATGDATAVNDREA